MGTNEGWPEAFGFSVSGDHPVVISAVEEEGSAQQAGLQTGDIVVELDGENVEQWTREEVGEAHVNIFKPYTHAQVDSLIPDSQLILSFL